jgi:surface antigen Omp85-like protein
MSSSTTLTRRSIAALAVICCAAANPAQGQQRGNVAAQNPVVTDYMYEPDGYLVEPDAITRAAIFADRHFGGEGLSNGLYIDFQNMVPGAGWISGGPGYRRWYSKDQMVLDASAAVSWHGYKTAQARIELPKLMRSRLLVGAQGKLQDFNQIAFYGEGPGAALSNESDYRLKSKDFVGYATLRPVKWLDVDGSVGWLAPSILAPSGLFRRDRPSVQQRFADNAVFTHSEQTFMHTELAATADRRDYPGHPTSGGLVRGVVTGYADRDAVFSFRRYEAEAEHFVPLDGARVVLALHGWVATSQTDPGQVVPFYLEPSIGGQNSLRSFPDYRFHDRNLALLNVEARIATFTHMDTAVFFDAGNVAPRFGDLNLDKRSYGAGVRFHTRRQTFARVDVARGVEGWRLVVRLTEPLNSSRYSRRTAAAPFGP